MKTKTSEEFNNELVILKASFKKEINKLRTMISEEVGEGNTHFYRIVLITELIEKDVYELIDRFSYLIDLNNEILSIKQQTDEIQAKLEKEINMPKFNEITDPVSQRVLRHDK